jgi:hypothetical protein
VADLRAAYARYPADRSIAALTGELLSLSPRFAAMWAEHEVSARHPMVKRVDHPLTGPIEFECQVLHIADTDQRLIAYIAAPGSPTEAAFRRLTALAREEAEFSDDERPVMSRSAGRLRPDSETVPGTGATSTTEERGCEVHADHLR